MATYIGSPENAKTRYAFENSKELFAAFFVMIFNEFLTVLSRLSFTYLISELISTANLKRRRKKLAEVSIKLFTLTKFS